MDVCVGIMLGTLVFKATNELALWRVGVTGLLAVLPDIDIVWPVLRGRVHSNHRLSPMHLPLPVLLVSTAVAGLVGGWGWADATFLCVLWHYIHDTPPLSTGVIPWLWPFVPRAPDEEEVDHHQWLKEHWLVMSPMLKREVGVGLGALCVAAIVASV